MLSSFEQAEPQVVDALRRYSEQAQNGQRLQRRLFTDDAVRGFSFVELCHSEFDVVLMNPPFGSAVKGSVTHLAGGFGPEHLFLNFIRGENAFTIKSRWAHRCNKLTDRLLLD